MKYYIVYNGLILNGKPFTSLEKAQNEQSLVIINYGYKPEIIDETEVEKYKKLTFVNSNQNI